MVAFENIIETVYPYAIGYSFSVIVGHLFVRLIVKKLWQSVEKSEDFSADWNVLATVQGSIERFLYTVSFQFGNPEFIGIWLVLKVASQWKKWSTKPGYNIFLIGTGLSIIYGVCGALMISWIKTDDIMLVVVPISLVVVSLILFIWVYLKVKFLLKNKE